MTGERRYTSRAFPAYWHIPGQTTHPNQEGGHSYQLAGPQVEDLDIKRAGENEAFLYALDLFNFGYYWESHVWWEALWHKAGRKGPVADFLKGLIKLSACGVKVRAHEKENVRNHFLRAQELFQQIPENLISSLRPLLQEIETENVEWGNRERPVFSHPLVLEKSANLFQT